jgi:hypothetical protein
VYPLVSLDLIVVYCCAPDYEGGINLKYSRCSSLLPLHARREAHHRGERRLSKLFRREMRAKVFVSLVWMDGEWGDRRKQFYERDSGEDKGCSYEGTAAKMLVQNEEGGQAGEDWFEGEEDRGVGRGEVLL